MVKRNRKDISQATKNSFTQLAGIFGKTKQDKNKKHSKSHSKNYRHINVGSIDEFLEPPKTTILKKKREPKIIVDSFGEALIGDWLRKHNIKFIREKKFKDLINPKTGQQLRFDFFLPDHKMCIEFDGKQHFASVKKFDKGDKFELIKRQFRDGLKDRFCVDREFLLLRITYKQIKDIEKILCRNLLINNTVNRIFTP